MEIVIIFALGITLILASFIIIKQRQKILRIMKFYEIGKKITSNIKIKVLIHEIMEIVKTETQAEACTLYLVDEEKHELWFEVALGEKGKELKETRLQIGEGSIAGWVAKNAKKLNIKDVNKDTRLNSIIRKQINYKQKAMLTTPVIFKNKVVAVLQIINKRGGGIFTIQDEELLEGIGSQVSIALENAKLYKNLRNIFVDTISCLTSAIDAKDPYTNGHSKRVTKYSVAIAKEMGLSYEELENLEYTSVLHDVGKIGIKDYILNKDEPLNEKEISIMKTHTEIGAKILEERDSLKRLVKGAKYHHEKYDGTGYFQMLKGDEIPLEARIISVADTYDAMTTDRPYRKALSHKIAIAEINRCSGTQFDPEVVRCFNKVMKGSNEQ